jgi:hypothetical protein
MTNTAPDIILSAAVGSFTGNNSAPSLPSTMAEWLSYRTKHGLMPSFLILAFFLPVEAAVNLNLKSSLLQNLLRGDRNAVGDDQATEARRQKQKAGMIQLDLSGKVNTHVIGPVLRLPESRQSSDGQNRPLIETNRPLSFIVSADYDFAQRWYGARRLYATLRWKQERLGRVFGKFLPVLIDLVGERGLDGGREATAGQLVFRWDNSGTVVSTVKARATRSGDVSLSLVLPVHNRIDFEMNVVNGFQLPKASSARMRQEPDSDWWIPNVAVNALGYLRSQNDVCFRSPLRQFDGSFHVRLVVRCRLGWSALGLAMDQEPEYWVGLHVQSSDDKRNQCSTTARIEAQLYRLRDSAHVSIRQDVAVGSKFRL